MLLMLVMSISAKEKQHIVTADEAGAYLNAEMDDFILVTFKRRALNIMCKVNPEYTKLIWEENGQMRCTYNWQKLSIDV